MDDFLKAYLLIGIRTKSQELIQSVEEKPKILEKDEDLRIYLEALYG